MSDGWKNAPRLTTTVSDLQVSGSDVCTWHRLVIKQIIISWKQSSRRWARWWGRGPSPGTWLSPPVGTPRLSTRNTEILSHTPWPTLPGLWRCCPGWTWLESLHCWPPPPPPPCCWCRSSWGRPPPGRWDWRLLWTCPGPPSLLTLTTDWLRYSNSFVTPQSKLKALHQQQTSPQFVNQDRGIQSVGVTKHQSYVNHHIQWSVALVMLVNQNYKKVPISVSVTVLLCSCVTVPSDLGVGVSLTQRVGVTTSSDPQLSPVPATDWSRPLVRPDWSYNPNRFCGMWLIRVLS